MPNPTLVNPLPAVLLPASLMAPKVASLVAVSILFNTGKLFRKIGLVEAIELVSRSEPPLSVIEAKGTPNSLSVFAENVPPETDSLVHGFAVAITIVPPPDLNMGTKVFKGLVNVPEKVAVVPAAWLKVAAPLMATGRLVEKLSVVINVPLMSTRV